MLAFIFLSAFTHCPVRLLTSPLIKYSSTIISKASTKMLYSEKFHWLLIEDLAWQGGRSSSSSGVHKVGSQDEAEEGPPGQQLQAPGNEELPTIESFMGGMNLYMNTELTLAKRMSEAAHYTLFDVWWEII